MRSSVFPLRWIGGVEDGYLEMLDQRQLPDREVWLVMSTAEEVAEGIEKMVIRGAPAIGIAAAYGVAMALRSHLREGADDVVEAIAPTIDRLGETRPTAVNLRWAIERMTSMLDDHANEAPEIIVERAFEEAEAMLEEDREHNRAMAREGARLFSNEASILTHCNTGGLATGGFGTALGVIRAVDADVHLEQVWIDETRPYLQGARLTAWECLKDDLPATLITDNMAAHFMSRGEVDAVVVGADRVAANGDVANKIGTYNLAVLARAHDIPFYVAAPVSTIDLEMPSGDEIPIEQRSESEVVEIGDTTIAPDGVSVAHPAFDVTPAEYVTAIVTERGVVEPPYEEGLERIVEENR